MEGGYGLCPSCRAGRVVHASYQVCVLQGISCAVVCHFHVMQDRARRLDFVGRVLHRTVLAEQVL